MTTGSEGEPGINGGMVIRRGPAPTDRQAVNSYVCTICVSSVDESAAKVVKVGGKIVVPKMAIKGVGWLVYCKDTEGNILGIMQDDPEARK